MRLELPATGERFISDDLWGCKSEMEHRHRYRSVAPLLKGKTVLDAACGSGYGSALLSQYARRVVGIDISAEAVAFSNLEYQSPNLSYRQMSVTDMQFDDGSFDAVVSFETIEHLAEEQQYAFLREARRVLKNDGVLIMSTPDRDVLRDIVNHGELNRYHLHEFTAQEYKGFLQTCFDIVDIYYQNIVQVSLISEKAAIDGDYPLIASEHFDSAEPSEYMVAVCSANSEHQRISPRGIYVPNVLQYYNETYRFFTRSSLYQDLGRGFTEEDKQMADVSFQGNEFRVSFTVDGEKARALRFDPCEAFCKIWDTRIVADGNADFRIMPDNAAYQENGVFWFMTSDPIYSLAFKQLPEKLFTIEITGKIAPLSSFELSDCLKRMIVGAKAETAQQVDRIVELDNQIYNMQNLLVEERIQNRKLDSVSALSNHYQSLVALYKNQYDFLYAQCESLKEINSAYAHSEFYKLTKPLRLLLDFFKQLFGTKRG